MTELVVCCGMPQEYDICKKYFGKSTIIKIEHSPDFDLAKLVPSDCKRIVSFGLAGGLSPRFQVGAIAIATKFRCPEFDYDISHTWYQKILERFEDSNLAHNTSWWYSSGNMGEGDTIYQRTGLFTKYHASSIDDESYFVVKFAKEHNLQTAIVRSISDDWQTNLPDAARGAVLNADGSANTSHVINSIWSNPWQIPALISTGLSFFYSIGTLKQSALVLGDDFGYGQP